MKTIEEIRLENLLELRSEFRYMREFAKRLKKSDNQVSQWFGNSSSRSIGSTNAREVEAVMGKPYGWLDNDQELQRRLNAATVKRVLSEMLPDIPQTSPATFAEKLRDAVFDA